MEMGRSPHFIADTWKEESMSNEHLKVSASKNDLFTDLCPPRSKLDRRICGLM